MRFERRLLTILPSARTCTSGATARVSTKHSADRLSTHSSTSTLARFATSIASATNGDVVVHQSLAVWMQPVCHRTVEVHCQ